MVSPRQASVWNLAPTQQPVSGLIEQLEFEKFSRKNAVDGANHTSAC